MANGNNIWRRTGIIFGIVVVFAGVVSGYTEVKLKAKKNEVDISEVKKDVKEIRKDLVALKIQNKEILMLVRFLKERME